MRRLQPLRVHLQDAQRELHPSRASPQTKKGRDISRALSPCCFSYCETGPVVTFGITGGGTTTADADCIFGAKKFRSYIAR